MLLRSDVRRLSIRQIRSQFPPRAFREMHSVRLQLGNVVVSVALDEVRALADHLAGSQAVSARQALVSKELATAHAQASALTVLLGSLLGKKNVDGVKLVSRVLTDATKRVAILTKAHADASGRDRPVLLVGHADQVTMSSPE